MPRSLLAYKDVVIEPAPNPDDPRLFRLHKKGFSAELRRMSDEEVEDWARLYPAWYNRKYRRMVVVWDEANKKVRVYNPKTRAHRSDYYAWIKDLPLPQGGYWYLLTLTFKREVGFRRSWANVNRWTSKFLNRFKVYVKTKYGISVSYIWVVEVHKDGFAHVHILFRMPFVQELNIGRLVSLFVSYWVDDDGNPLSAPQGVDLRYLGRNVQQVRDYALKYLVKNHHKYWLVKQLPDGRVAYRRSSAYMFLFRVKLFGMSQDIRAMLREKQEKEKGKRVPSGLKFYGTISANRLHKLFYKPLGISYWYWLEFRPEVGWSEYPDSYLPLLVPSAFSARGSPSDGSIDDLMEHF
jgi:hypothetical protein